MRYIFISIIFTLVLIPLNAFAGDKNVIVVNTPMVDIANEPIDVKDVDNSARQFFTVECLVPLEDGEDGDDVVCITVPLFKTLVIEYVSFFSAQGVGQIPSPRIRVPGATVGGNPAVAMDMFITIQQVDAGRYIASNFVKLYARSNSVVQVRFNRFGGSTGSALGQFKLSGYLVDN